MAETDVKAPFFIADTLIEPASNSILCGGRTKRIEPKAMNVLILLASRAGQVVTREELEDSIWTNMVVGPDSLTNTIIKLRRALGDDAKNTRFIETIPKTGYRLIAPVREAQEGDIEQPLVRRLSAILYADVAEYSRLTGEDEDRTHRLLSANLDLFSETVLHHNGNVVHYAGDAILAEFTTVTDALSCAVEVQRNLQNRNEADADAARVQFRIGINLGEVIVDRDDIYGDGVNIAARLESLADVGGICISESVYAAIGNKLALDYEFMGEQLVKNISDPVRAYRVLLMPQVRKPGLLKKILGRTPALIIVTIIAVLAGGGYFLSLDEQNDTQVTEILQQDKPTIAVLPFANVSVDANDEYFADGMTGDLITDLSKISGIYVLARSTVFAYKNKSIDVEQIGRELGVHYIVEGSIYRTGDRVKINVHLVDTTNGRLLWSERQDRDYAQYFNLQNEVISQVVSAVSVRLTDAETAQIERQPTSNLQAYDYYVRAEQAGYIDGSFDLSETLDLYRKAISYDPEFAEAYSGLARVAVEAWRNDSEVIVGAAARSIAYEAASRALEIDSANGQAYSVIALLQLADGHHDAAINSARKAVKVAPGSSSAHLDLGLVLAYAGESKQGVAAIETALRLNPKPNADMELYTGIVFFIDAQYQRAESAISKGINEGKGSEPGLIFLAAARGKLGDIDRAEKASANLLASYPNSSLEYIRIRENYFKRPRDLENLLAGLRVAGLPQWAFDFRESADERIVGTDLHRLIDGKSWIGNHANGAEFFMQIESSGSMAYRSSNSIQTGTVSIQGDMLCQFIEGSALGKGMCGYVYNNPEGTEQGRNLYVVSLPDSLRFFDIVE